MSDKIGGAMAEENGGIGNDVVNVCVSNQSLIL